MTSSFLRDNYRAVGIIFNIYLNASPFGMNHLSATAESEASPYVWVRLYVPTKNLDLPDLYMGKKYNSGDMKVEPDHSRFIVRANPFGGVKS